MGKLTYALGSENLNFNYPDFLIRSVQAAVTGAIQDGESFFFRSSGDAGNGPENITILINPASQMSFRYDGLEIPEPDEDMVKTLREHISKGGGLSLDLILNGVNKHYGESAEV